MNRPAISQELVKELLHYDPDTGIFVWCQRSQEWFPTARSHKGWNTRFSGKTAGSPQSTGYLMIGFVGHFCLAHRLAFLYMTGEFPAKDTDHINGKKTDNRWGNLRSVTRQENMKNRAVQKNNTTGFIGVQWYKRLSKWVSRIRIKGKHIHLGYFDEFEDAVSCRRAAEMQYNFHENHGRQRIMAVK